VIQGASPLAPLNYRRPLDAKEGGSPPSYTPPSEEAKPKKLLPWDTQRARALSLLHASRPLEETKKLPWDEKREAEERERAERAARLAAEVARRAAAAEQAWKAAGISPESMSGFVCSVFTYVVTENPGAEPWTHLKLTLEKCAKYKFEISQEVTAIIDAALLRLKVEESRSSIAVEAKS
jgi:hypothetical protein